MSDIEYDQVEKNAKAQGLSKGSYSRLIMLGAMPPKAGRRAPADKIELAKLLANFGKIGSNINQIAHRVNVADKITPGVEALVEIADQVRVMKEHLIKALKG